MPEMTELEAFEAEFVVPSKETPNGDVETPLAPDSVSDIDTDIAQKELETVNVDDVDTELDDSGTPPVEQEPPNYQELYEQSLAKQETLKTDVETANKRQSDTQKNWHEMNSRLKELEEKRSKNDLPPDGQDPEISELQEELPEYADAIENAIDKGTERKFEELRKKRELETQQVAERKNQREAAHYKALEDTKYGIPGFREKCRTSKFEEWAESNPDHKILFAELAAEQEKDEFSNRVLQIKSGIMRRYENDQKLTIAKEQRKNANEKHNNAVLDMATQLPTSRSGTVKSSVPLTKREEEMEGFLSVFP